MRLGTSTLTLGQAGCLVTAAAEMLRRAGWDVDPARLNRWLALNRGFVNGSAFVFGALERAAEGVALVAVRDWSRVAADVDELRAWLAAGYGVLVQVLWDPADDRSQHWLLALAWRDEGCMPDLLVHDPWLGTSVPLLLRYARMDWDLARAIYRAAAYACVEATE